MEDWARKIACMSMSTALRVIFMRAQKRGELREELESSQRPRDHIQNTGSNTDIKAVLMALRQTRERRVEKLK